MKYFAKNLIHMEPFLLPKSCLRKRDSVVVLVLCVFPRRTKLTRPLLNWMVELLMVKKSVCLWHNLEANHTAATAMGMREQKVGTTMEVLPMNVAVVVVATTEATAIQMAETPTAARVAAVAVGVGVGVGVG